MKICIHWGWGAHSFLSFGLSDFALESSKLSCGLFSYEGTYEGSLLIACVDDEDNGTILIAYAMAKVECESSRLLALIHCHD